MVAKEITWILVLCMVPLLVVMTVIDIRSSRYGRRVLHLPKGQYVRRLVMEVLDPVVEVLFIGVVLWQDLAHDGFHWLAGAVGVVAGYFLARYRAKIMYVRAVPEYKAIVSRRSVAEYLVLVLLIVVKFLSESTSLHSYWFSLLITAGLLLVVSESALRVTFIFRRYRRETAEAGAKTRE